MRLDCRIYPHSKLRLPQIPICSPGRNHEAQRGDLIAWQLTCDPASAVRHGRVLGVVVPDDEPKKRYLLTIATIGSHCCENWVDPADVIDCTTIRDYSMLMWLYSPTFLMTPIDKARRCSDLYLHEMTGYFDPGLVPRKQ